MSSKYKLLVVDDDRTSLHALFHTLRHEYEISAVGSGEAAVKKAIAEKPDLILLDIVMADMSGYDVLSILKAHDETRDIPVIFITGLETKENEKEGLRLGAVDYITKPFNVDIVRARVKTHITIAKQLREAESLGYTDHMTDLANRRGFERQASMEWARAIRKQEPFSVLRITVDNIKLYIDTYGHILSDTLLRTIAHTIKSFTRRPTDFAARWGDEEFVVVLPDTPLSGALTVAEFIRSNVETTTAAYEAGIIVMPVTVSIGVATAVPTIGSKIDGLVAEADRALEAAVLLGRNRVSAGLPDNVTG